MTPVPLTFAAVAVIAVVGAARGRGAFNRPKPGKLKVYHGTNRSLDSFDRSFIGDTTDAGTEGAGFYFHTDRDAAVSHAQWATWKHGGEPTVIEAEVTISRPKYLTRNNSPRHLESDPAAAMAYSQSLKREGHDGVIKEVMDGESYVVVVYDPQQIQIVNTQTVDPW